MTGAGLKGYNELRQGVARIAWPGLNAFTLSGPDASDWLQGQVTGDLRRLDDSPAPILSCLVKPTGQLLSVLRVWRRDGQLVVVEEGVPTLSERVETFVIMEDVVLTDLGPVPWVLSGPNVADALGDLSGDERLLPSARTRAIGFDVLSRAPEWLEEIVRRVPVEADQEALQAALLEDRIPLIGTDNDPKTLPPELGKEFDALAVSYEKGCYVGQEVLQRIHSRGHTNRTWTVLRVAGEVDPDASVTLLDGSVVGRVTHCCMSPSEGFLAGAMLRPVAEDAKLMIGTVTVY